MSSITNIDGYIQFKKDKSDTFCTCGVVLRIHDHSADKKTTEIYAHFGYYEDGLYMSGMFQELFLALEHIYQMRIPANLWLKVHPRNNKFKISMQKVIHAIALTSNVPNIVLRHDIHHQQFVDKAYNKPAAYTQMMNIADVVYNWNQKCDFKLYIGVDKDSIAMERTYMGCCAYHNKRKFEVVDESQSNILPFPGTN